MKVLNVGNPVENKMENAIQVFVVPTDIAAIMNQNLPRMVVNMLNQRQHFIRAQSKVSQVRFSDRQNICKHK